ncbi:hypothetical protein J2Z40_002853, partial [Cytobacillus eiseniae]|nr:hypothetical protein [Cytobacillus eiseniae]
MKDKPKPISLEKVHHQANEGQNEADLSRKSP